MSFRSWQSFMDFKNKVLHLHNNRYHHDDEETLAFLAEVLKTCYSREQVLKEGSTLWRSQLGGDTQQVFDEGELINEVPCPYAPDRMVPLKDVASEGRANPKGIPYL